MQASDHPKRDERGVAERKCGKSVQHVVVAEMNYAVNNTQSDVGPRNIDSEARRSSRHIQNHTNHIEEQRQLKQVHVVPVWNADIGWDRRRLSVLEILRTDLAAPNRPNSHEWDFQQHQK